MKRLKTVLLLAFFCPEMQAQTPGEMAAAQPPSHFKKAAFPGGEAMLAGFFQENLRYPSLALENGLEEEVGLRLSLLENGEIGDIKTVEPLSLGCDEEARRLVLALPPWRPATLGGKPVPSKVYLKIRFRLR
jgi:protein TonB